MQRICVIDVGSNSIKMLIAEKSSADTAIHRLDEQTEETRIAKGMDSGQLDQESMLAAVQSILSLKRYAQHFAPQEIYVTATSAVRDADNKQRFLALVKQATELDVQVLSGQEEAGYIAAGVCQDPSIEEGEFQVLDLGGGSMEVIAFRNHAVLNKESLQLGAVRLTESLLTDATAPISTKRLNEVGNHVQSTLSNAAFPFIKSPLLIGLGGAVTHARLLIASKEGIPFKESSPILAVKDLITLRDSLSKLSLEERISTYDLPPQRADIMPVALQTLISTATLAGVDSIRHSRYNLRYGIASTMLTKLFDQ
ncbi:MAG: hypothetical protein JW739_02335 [Opitutales bacterium]|nr:hypothetical protein [Opitutales bacterium]